MRRLPRAPLSPPRPRPGSGRGGTAPPARLSLPSAAQRIPFPFGRAESLTFAAARSRAGSSACSSSRRPLREPWPAPRTERARIGAELTGAIPAGLPGGARCRGAQARAASRNAGPGAAGERQRRREGCAAWSHCPDCHHPHPAHADTFPEPDCCCHPGVFKCLHYSSRTK